MSSLLLKSYYQKVTHNPIPQGAPMISFITMGTQDNPNVPSLGGWWDGYNSSLLINNDFDHTKAVQQAKNDLKDLVETFQQELGRLLTPFEIEDLTKTVREDQTDPDVIKAALREAVFNGKPHWKYIQAILRNWRHEGIRSVAQVEAKREEREATNPQNVQVSSDFKNAMDLWKD